MSDTDSFIEEVTEEVRRDKLYGYLRKYGWIGVLFVILVVGGTAWQSWSSAQEEARAQALGDALLAAFDAQEPEARIEALSGIEAGSTTALAMRDFLLASAQIDSGAREAARATLQRVEDNAELPMVYRQIASFKSLTATARTTGVEERRAGFEALAQPGSPLRLLAEEQLALIEIETGAPDAALARLQSVLSDAEVTSDLQQRAAQVIVALGGEPDLSFATTPAN